MQVPPKKHNISYFDGWQESSEDESSGLHEDEEEFLCPVCGEHIGYMGTGTEEEYDANGTNLFWKQEVDAKMALMDLDQT